MTGVAFAAVGAMKSRFVDQAWWRSALETVAIGSLAAVLAYAAGRSYRESSDPPAKPRRAHRIATRLRCTHTDVVEPVLVEVRAQARALRVSSGPIARTTSVKVGATERLTRRVRCYNFVALCQSTRRKEHDMLRFASRVRPSVIVSAVAVLAVLNVLFWSWD
jgi:hypothetical protein